MRGGVPARHSDDQVRVGAMRYKKSFKVLVVNSEYSIHGPHNCKDLFNAPDAWPLVPVFGPGYTGPQK